MYRIRDWLSRFSSGSTSSNPVKTQDTDRAARETRADHVADLQARVSQLQQEILALSNAAGTSKAQMAALERELDEAQRELAKYQGRI
jgi:peptidoglycan hydrolase CwlO-like protein